MLIQFSVRNVYTRVEMLYSKLRNSLMKKEVLKCRDMHNTHNLLSILNIHL